MPDESEEELDVVLDEEQPEDASEFRREVQPVRATATHVEGEMCTVTAPSGERAGKSRANTPIQIEDWTKTTKIRKNTL